MQILRSCSQFLGIVSSKDGLQADPARIDAIDNLRPKDQKEVRALLGLVNYYGKLVQHLHRIKKLLECVLRRNVPFNWTSKKEEAFNVVKDTLLVPTDQ